MVPLVEAMVANGDEVTVAGDAGIEPHVAATGAAFRPCGHDEPTWFERLSARTRGVPGDGLAPGRIDHYFVPRAFAEVGGDDMIDDLLAIARDTEPHVVVFDTYALAAPLVAAVVGARPVQHLVGPLLDPGVLELANDAISPLWRSFGLDAPGFAGVYAGTTIEICPASFESRTVPSGTSLRLRPTPLPREARVATERPLVYVTLGTFFTNPGLFRTVLDALADEPVDVLVTVGRDGDPSTLGDVPGNATVERFVPQAEVLVRCSAVVHHCGGGTTFGALAHGLPQVALPQGADNFVNAALLERAGVAIQLREPEVTPRTVRDAVRRVLAERPFADAAGRLAAEIAAMPDPTTVASELRAG
jgi:hypothetical protein